MKSITRIKVIILAISLMVFGLFGQFALAADPLVPCGPASLGFEQMCDTCQLFKLAQNIVTLITTEVAPVLAVIMIVVGAFFLLTAGGSEKAITKGKTIITSAIVGIMIILASWLVINLILSSLAPKATSGPWYQINCE